MHVGSTEEYIHDWDAEDAPWNARVIFNLIEKRRLKRPPFVKLVAVEVKYFASSGKPYQPEIENIQFLKMLCIAEGME